MSPSGTHPGAGEGPKGECALPVHGIWDTRQNTDPTRKLVDTHALRWLILAYNCHASLPSHGESSSHPGCRWWATVGQEPRVEFFPVRRASWREVGDKESRDVSPRVWASRCRTRSRPARAWRAPRSLQAQGNTGRVTSCPPSSSRSGVRRGPYAKATSVVPAHGRVAALVASPDEVQPRNFGSVCRTDDVCANAAHTKGFTDPSRWPLK